MLSSAPQLKPPSLPTFSEGIFLTYPHWIDFSFSMFPWPWRWIISAHQKLMVNGERTETIKLTHHHTKEGGAVGTSWREHDFNPYSLHWRPSPDPWTAMGVSLFQYSADAIKFYTYRRVNTLENHCWYHCVLFFPKHLWLSEINTFVYWFISSPFTRI